MISVSGGAENTAPPTAAPARLDITGLTKTFGQTRALDRVDLHVAAGEIHGLLGQNGSGKSTLIKILSGFHAADTGSVSIDGQSVVLPMPVSGHEKIGLAFVHQNLGLFTGGTVLENLIAGDHGRLNRWKIDWRSEAERARNLFASYQLDLNPHTLVESLSPVKRAQLAIVRAADRVQQHASHQGPGLLILDEPTPFLPLDDVRDLFDMMRKMAGSGVSIVFVSHDIDEIMDVTDRATVLRDGRAIGTFQTETMHRAEIVEMIVGRSVRTGRRARESVDDNNLAQIRVKGLGGKIVRNLDLEIRPGEIVGMTGLIGSGYDEVPYLLGGATKAMTGQLSIGRKEYDLAGFSPAQSKSCSIVLIPADRQKNALAPELTLLENISLPVLGKIGSKKRVDHAGMLANARQLLARFSVKAEGPSQLVNDLSGGNQQKVVLAKWLQIDPVLVLLDEPTQGIDVGARAEIYDILEDLCARGASVICASSEFEQLESIAHKVLVFDRGRVVAQLAAEGITKSAIANACYSAMESHHGKN